MKWIPDWTQNPRRTLPALLAVLSGLLCALAFPNPWAIALTYPGGFLAWIALVPLLGVAGHLPAQGIRWGFVSGLVYFGISIFWMAQMPSLGPLAPGVWLLLTAYLACFPAVFLGLLAWFKRQGTPVWSAAPALWVALEYIRNYCLSGFPWVALGYAHHLNPWMMALAPFAGVWGLSYLTVWVSALGWEGLRARKPTPGTQRNKAGSWMILQALFSLTMVSLLLVGGWAEHHRLRKVPDQAPAIKAAALQGNIDQNQPWDDAYRRMTLNRFHALAERAVAQKAEWLIWPESSFPGIFNWDHLLAQEVKNWSLHWQVNQTVSSDTVDTQQPGQYRYFNSMIWVDPSGTVTGRISKIHLVPFGEYIPFKQSLLFFVRKLVPRYDGGEFTPGTLRAPLWGRFSGRLIPVGGLICFESIFPQYAAELVRQGSGLLMVVTYDAWFGITAAAAQHAIFSAFRAAETDRYLVRTAATGISCFYSPEGKLLGALPLNQADLLVGEVHPRTTRTFYVRHGDWLPWLCLAWIACLAWAAWQRKTPAAPAPTEAQAG